MRNKRILSLVLVVMFLVAASALAQDQTGSIFGVITTTDGAAIGGAKVAAKSDSLIRAQETTTNDRGVYVFPALPVGDFTLTVSAENYKSYEITDIFVSAGQQLRVNAQLEVGVVGEEVITITGEAPLIDVKSTDTGMSISKDLFKALPKGRSFQSLVRMAPGVTQDDDRGGLFIDGASSSENVWVIDGASVNNIVNGRDAQNAVFEFVEEIQIRSGGYEAEFGGSMGGVVNVITRSGGNQFSGEGDLYFTSSHMNADPRPSLRINPVDDETPEYFDNPKDKWTQYEFGGALGGYLIKDRVWFFGSYLPRHYRENRTVDFRDAYGDIYLTEDYARRDWTHNAAIKVSSQVTDKLRASGSFSTDFYRTVGTMPGYQGLDNPDSPWGDLGNRQPGFTAAGNVDYLVSDAIYANAKFGWHMTDFNQLGVGAAFSEPRFLMNGSMTAVIPPAELAQIPAQYVKGNGWYNYVWATFNATMKDFRMQYNASADATYFTQMGGDHMFKGGFQWFWLKNDVLAGNPKQYYTFWWNTDATWTNPITGEEGRGDYGYYRVLSYGGLYGLDGRTASSRYALFLQDSWSPSSRMTVNAGVRLESEHLPSYNPEFPDPLNFGFTDKIAPRIGVAYDMFGDGKLKLFGNFGVYHDVMKLEMAREGYGGRIWIDRRYTLDTWEWWTFPDVIGPSGNYPGTPIGPSEDHRIPAIDTTDPDCMPMEQHQYIVGADYQLADNLALNSRFVYNHLIRTIEDVGILTDQGEMYWHGNPGFGASKRILEENDQPSTKAVRDYMALELRLSKRFSNNWAGGVNITFSKTRGNYSGLTSSDEYGRASPNVNRYFDLWFLSFDSYWREAIGPMPTDRRYMFNFYASYQFDWAWLKGLTVGVFQSLNDGAARTTEFNFKSQQGYYPEGRGDMGRENDFLQTDLYAEYNLNLSGGRRMQFNVNVDNIFDATICVRTYPWINRDNVVIEDDELLAMYHSNTSIPWRSLFGPGTGKRADPRYGMDQIFQGPRTIRLGVKFFF